jgi:DNA-binding MarR family transcriptional regulator
LALIRITDYPLNQLFAMQRKLCYQRIMTEKAMGRSRGEKAEGRRESAEGEPSRGRLSGLLGYFLRRAEVYTFQNFNAHLAGDRIRPGQLGILLMCEANPGINQTRLGKALGIDRSTLVAMIDLLEARGLVARSASATDRRSHALRLTEQGEELLSDLQPRLARHEAEVARKLSAAERRQLIALLSRIAP